MELAFPTLLASFKSDEYLISGINERSNAIVIFTERKLTVSEQKLLAYATSRVGDERIHVEFVHGSVAQNGPNPPPPPAVRPYMQHNGRYTSGSSVYIGSEKGAGTLGCLVQDGAGALYGLSNNHVTGGSNYAVPGLPIVAPGMADVAAGGQDPETLGHHHSAYPFIDGIPGIVDAHGNIDAAIFAISNPDGVSSMQRDQYDTPGTVASIAVGMNVQKIGRSSGVTNGTVIAELFDFEPIGYIMDIIRGHKLVYFQSLFVIKSTTSMFSNFSDIWVTCYHC